LQAGFITLSLLHLESVYKHLGYERGDLSVAEKVAEEILSLPMFPELTMEQVEYVVEQIKNYVPVKSVGPVSSV